MSDPILHANLFRAQQSLANVMRSDQSRAKTKAFVDAARAILRSGTDDFIHNLRSHPNPHIAKAVDGAALTTDWDNSSREMAEAYLGSITEQSIIDSLKAAGARFLPQNLHRALIASGAVGNVVAEGDPKPTTQLQVNDSGLENTKAVGLLVASEELLSATGEKLFEAELESAVARASNSSILSMLTPAASPISGTGDPLADLRAGLAAAPASNGYVVAMPSGRVADLATRLEAGPGFGVRGGEFRPGIHIVAVDGATVTTVIAASRVALWDGGLTLRSARHASVDLRDVLEGQPELTSLWQANLWGILIERSWRLAAADGVIVVEAS